MADAWKGLRPRRFEFQVRGTGDDGLGTELPGMGDFETQFTFWASLKPRTGGEGVDAARLSGTQPYIVRVRNSTETRQITTAWQLVDANDGSRFLAVTSPPADPDGKREWLEFIAIEGRVS